MKLVSIYLLLLCIIIDLLLLLINYYLFILLLVVHYYYYCVLLLWIYYFFIIVSILSIGVAYYCWCNSMYWIECRRTRGHASHGWSFPPNARSFETEKKQKMKRAGSKYLLIYSMKLLFPFQYLLVLHFCFATAIWNRWWSCDIVAIEPCFETVESRCRAAQSEFFLCSTVRTST